MGTFKKILSCTITAILLSVGVCTQSVCAGTTTDFTDVATTAWYYDSVNRIVDLGITAGKGNNLFAPNDSVTKAEFVTFLCKATGLSQTDGYTYSDTAKHWAQKWISTAVESQIIDKDTAFNPNQAITRQEAVEMLCKSLNLSPNNEMETPYCDVDDTNQGYLNKAFEEYLMTGSLEKDKRYFYPENDLKRSEVAAVIVNLVDYKADTANYKAQKKALMDTQKLEQEANLDNKQIEVTVSNAKEFVAQLGSNKKILLKPGVYNLSSVKQTNTQDETVTWEDVEDGKELNLTSINNLTIEGLGNEGVEIEIAPRYANIFNFNSCKNIQLKNIKAGHTPSEYECDEGVLNFEGCKDLTISNCELYGCGSVGITAYNTVNLNCEDTLIDHCSLRAINLSESEFIKFVNCQIIKHEAYSNIVYAEDSGNIEFDKCLFSDNNNFQWSFFDIDSSDILINDCKITKNLQPVESDWEETVCFFNASNDSYITVKNSELSGNRCDYLCNDKDSISFENCEINNNIWLDNGIKNTPIENLSIKYETVSVDGAWNSPYKIEATEAIMFIIIDNKDDLETFIKSNDITKKSFVNNIIQDNYGNYVGCSTIYGIVVFDNKNYATVITGYNSLLKDVILENVNDCTDIEIYKQDRDKNTYEKYNK